MIEPNITEQLLGVGIMLLGIFVLMLFTMKHESKEDEATEEVTTDFYTIARMNLKKSDKQFTYDVEPPIGLNQKGQKKMDKGIQEIRYPRVRLPKEIYDRVADIANECDMKMSDVIAQLTKFAFKHIEVKEEQILVKKLYIGD